jgi:hypothetical protein
MTKYVIAKYADEVSRLIFYDDNYQFTLRDSIHNTFTGHEVGCPAVFDSEKEAKPWLDKLIESNPSVGYGIVPVEDHQGG